MLLQRGGLARDQLALHDAQSSRPVEAAHALDEHRDRGGDQLILVGPDRGQGRGSELRQLDVIEAHDGRIRPVFQ